MAIPEAVASLVRDGKMDIADAILNHPEATQAIMEAESVRSAKITVDIKRSHRKTKAHALFKPESLATIKLRPLDEVVRSKDEPTLYYEDMPIVKALSSVKIRPFNVKKSDIEISTDEDQEGPFSRELLYGEPGNETLGASYDTAKKSIVRHKAVANEKVEARVQKPLVLKEMTHRFGGSTLRADVTYGVITPRKMHIPLAGGTSWQPDPSVEKNRHDLMDCYLFNGRAEECSRAPTVAREVSNKSSPKEAGKL